MTFYNNNQKFTRKTFEEKELDVNLSLVIVEDAYEKISDKIIVITNDSDIAPAIKMAREKNLAAGNVSKNKKGQVYVLKLRRLKSLCCSKR